MSELAVARKTFLENKFQERVTFDRTERKLYGHDVGELPALIKPLIGSTVPDAVVQPENEADLRQLMQWAGNYGIPLTPRGMATSGYGGVLPVRNGIVVDFTRMKQVISIDKNTLTATVQPGIIWETLDNALAKENLTLRLYPTSYPASTVGGWLAQGGAGIGSYESGWFYENVISARVVLPDGSVRDFTGEELDLVSDAEGITGFISQITLKVQILEEMLITSVAVEDTAALQVFADKILHEDLPLWSFLFINPQMADFKNRTPLRQQHGHDAEEHVELPRTFIATLTYRIKDKAAIDAKLDDIVKSVHGVRLDEQIARHEWDSRFRVMKVKRLGPSLVPAEIVVPLENIADAIDEIKSKIAQPIVKEGLIVRDGKGGKPQVVILGFIPCDQRKFNYLFVFSLSVSITKIAEKYGGRAYATGLYQTGKASAVLGKDRFKKLRDFKKQIDPQKLLNPDKVIGSTVVSKAITIAGVFEPVTRIFGNNSKTAASKKSGRGLRGIPADVAEHAYSCSQCGYCVNTCDQFYGRGWESQSPRGKWYWLREFIEGREKWNQKAVDTFMVCTTCERCNLRCPEAIPVESSWMKLRGKLIHEDKKMTFPPFEMMAAALADQGNIWAGYRKNRLDWFPEDLKEKHGPGKKAKTVYFAGCTASYVENDIAIATTRLLDEAGIDFVHMGVEENCCGIPMLVAGKWDLFAENMKKNIKLIKQTGADTVITSCPACDMMWRHTYGEWSEKLGIEYSITAKHYSQVVTEKIAAGEFAFPSNGHKRELVTWHDSCHIGRVSNIYEPPRDLIKANPKADFIEMASNRDAAKCCGSVLTLIKEPKVAAEIGKDRLDEAVEIGVKKVLAMCPCCQVQLRISAEKKDIPVEVVDLARFSAESLGYELPDPNPEVKRQWGVFEAMIDLMTPQGFADLMGTMWPELLDAMPLGMGSMMRFFGKIPGALNLMKPMFPILFPILLPKMMPKLMPTMLDRVAAIVPMPDNMAEQMPGMMPGIMDNLMPHMIGDLVPLVTQPMIDHLRGKVKEAV